MEIDLQDIQGSKYSFEGILCLESKSDTLDHRQQKVTHGQYVEYMYLRCVTLFKQCYYRVTQNNIKLISTIIYFIS